MKDFRGQDRRHHRRRLSRARRTPRLAARPHPVGAGPQDAARSLRRPTPRSGSRCGWAIARACPTRCRSLWPARATRDVVGEHRDHLD